MLTNTRRPGFGIDGSPSSLRVIEFVTKHAEIFGVKPKVTLITVHLPMPSQRAKAMVGKEIMDQYYSDESDAVLADTLAHLKKVGQTAEVLKLVGEPGHEIAEAGKNGFQMIVMGTHGRTALMNLVMGSVAMRTIAESSIPVLLIK